MSLGSMQAERDAATQPAGWAVVAGALLLVAVLAASARPDAVVAPGTSDGAGAAGADRAAGCRPGFVRRDAAPGDDTCVGAMSRDRVALENRLAASRLVARDDGTAECIAGMVPRAAVDGDTTCVPPRVRDLVRAETELGLAQRGDNEGPQR